MRNHTLTIFIMGFCVFQLSMSKEPKCKGNDWFKENLMFDSKTPLVEGFQGKIYRGQLKDRNLGWTEVMVQAAGRMKNDPNTKEINVEAIWNAINRLESWGNQYQTVVPLYKHCIKFSPENYMIIYEKLGDFLQSPEVLGKLTKKRALPFRIDTYLAILNQADKIHKKKVIHCDLQPSTILMKDETNFRIVGFGMSSTDQCRAATRFFSAPEVYEEPKLQFSISSKADAYSLGVTLLMIEEYKQYESLPNNVRLVISESPGRNDHRVIIQRIDNLQKAKKKYFDKECETAVNNYLEEKASLVDAMDKITKKEFQSTVKVAFEKEYAKLSSHWQSLMTIIRRMTEEDYNERSSLKQAIERLESLRFDVRDDHKKIEPKIPLKAFSVKKEYENQKAMKYDDNRNKKTHKKIFYENRYDESDQIWKGQNRKMKKKESSDYFDIDAEFLSDSDNGDLNSSDDLRLRI